VGLEVDIRRIRPDEGLQLWALRLHALADVPVAFGSTLAREQAFAESVWHERATGGAAGTERVTFIPQEDTQWVGLATGLAEDPDKLGHSPMLVGMCGLERASGAHLLRRWLHGRGQCPPPERPYVWDSGFKGPMILMGSFASGTGLGKSPAIPFPPRPSYWPRREVEIGPEERE